MKFYVAGITINQSDKNLSIEKKSNLVSRLLRQAHADAKSLMGEDVIVVAVMQEYAFTPTAVPTSSRKKSLGILRKLVNQFDNMIFIPDTYATVDKYDDAATKKRKLTEIRKNYSDVASSDFVNVSSEIQGFQRILMDKKRKLEDYTILQNCAYMLTSSQKFKRRKCAPCYELDKMPSNTTNGFYYIDWQK